MTSQHQIAIQLLAALAIGLLIGIERGWRKSAPLMVVLLLAVIPGFLIALLV